MVLRRFRFMSRELVFDIETDGLLEDGPKGAALTKLHCIGAIDVETEEEFLFPPERLGEGLEFLSKARRLIGHNIIQFDLKAILRVYPQWKQPVAIPFDTIVAAKVVWPGDVLWNKDDKLVREGKLPAQFRKRYSLKAFGYRLGFLKGEYAEQENAWVSYSQEMGDYCIQDCRVQLALYKRIRAENVPDRVYDLEMRVHDILYRQERRGFWFDHASALSFVSRLQNRQAELEERLQEHFRPWASPIWDVRTDPVSGVTLKDQQGRALKGVRVDTFKSSRKVKLPEHPDVTLPRFGKNGKELAPYVGPPFSYYEEGSTFCPIELVTFNPSSRAHIADRLEKLYGWKPTEFTPDGQAKLDETILKALPYPPCEDLVEYFVVTKIGGMLAQGSQAWLRNYNEGTHRVHGRMDGLGTITGRASHSNPNLGQVPSVAVGEDHLPVKGVAGGYGWESRSLFTAPPGMRLLGCDASGLELRCLSHYMAPFDGGAYADTVVNGDVHTLNQQAAGLKSRASAKTMIYAFLYGAGDVKLGSIVMEDRSEAGWSDKKLRSEGKKLRAALLHNLPALGKLIDAVKKKARKEKRLKGLDGRPLYIRSDHAALNTLLQSAGAIICKQWLVQMEDNFKAEGLTEDKDQGQMAWVHDEVQIAVRSGVEEVVGNTAVRSIREVADVFGFRCALNGEFKTGRTWAETH